MYWIDENGKLWETICSDEYGDVNYPVDTGLFDVVAVIPEFDQDEIDEEPLPDFVIWATDGEGCFDHVIMTAWTWEQAIRAGKACAIARGAETRIQKLMS